MKSASPSYESAGLRELDETIRGRRTINLYLQTPVPPQLVRDAIDAAVWAPNHHVTEPWRFYLLGRESIARCVELVRDMTLATKGPDAAAFKAKSWAEKPGWLVVTCQRCEDPQVQHEDYGACAAAVQNLLLYLSKAHVGTKWTTGQITRDPRFFDILGVDSDQAFVVGLVWYGYAKITPAQSRRPGESVTVELA